VLVIRDLKVQERVHGRERCRVTIRTDPTSGISDK
jgi:hypothetical protein